MLYLIELRTRDGPTGRNSGDKSGGGLPFLHGGRGGIRTRTSSAYETDSAPILIALTCTCSVAAREGLEPSTIRVTTGRSCQLSYRARKSVSDEGFEPSQPRRHQLYRLARLSNVDGHPWRRVEGSNSHACTCPRVQAGLATTSPAPSMKRKAHGFPRSRPNRRVTMMAWVRGIEPRARGFGIRCSATELHPSGDFARDYAIDHRSCIALYHRVLCVDRPTRSAPLAVDGLGRVEPQRIRGFVTPGRCRTSPAGQPRPMRSSLVRGEPSP